MGGTIALSIFVILGVGFVIWTFLNLDKMAEKRKEEIANANIEDFRPKDTQKTTSIENGEELVKIMKKRSWKAFGCIVTIPAIMFFAPIIIGIISSIKNNSPLSEEIFFGDSDAVIGFFIFFLIFLFIGLYNKKHTFSGKVFDKYGNPDDVVKIINEIEATKEYETNNLIISKNYIMYKDYYETIMACDDIVKIYIYKYKQYTRLVVVDDYDDSTYYDFTGNEKYIYNVMDYLKSKCKNIKSDEWWTYNLL